MGELRLGHGDPRHYRKPPGGSDISPAPPSSARHCWMVTSHDRQPVLLLEWRRTPEGDWEGYVLRAIPGGFAATWVRDLMLQPAHHD